MTDAFDPATVPPFPVVTLELRDDDTVAVDGRDVDIDPDGSPRDAGIAAVATRAQTHGLSAVRVRAISPDGTHLLVVTADGVPYALEDPAQVAADSRRTRQRRTRTIALASVCVLALAAAGGTTAFVLTRPAPAPAVAAPALPPNQGSQLPVLAPPGYSQTAAWAIPVTARTTPALIDAGHIAAVDDSGNLLIVDTATGQPTWRGSGAPSGRAGITYTHVDGRPMLASAASQSLTLWPVDVASGSTVSSQNIKTGSRATVSYRGSNPLIDLGDQTAAVVRGGRLARLDIPVTSTPILATDTAVIAANSEHIWTIPTDGTTVEAPMIKPEGATGQPTLISAATDTTLVTLWPTDEAQTNIAALVNTADGTVLASTRVQARAANTRDVLVRSADATTMAIGSLFIDLRATPAIMQVPGFSPTVVDGSTVYGIKDNSPIAGTSSGGTFTVQKFSTVATDDRTAPAAVAGDTAFVVAKKVETTYLYALPRSESAR